ncbi:hypothetical protein CCMA1212_009174 [Trichoderma ghanense]|uniref:Uncharacterized protein n=1 Tax=Trichoderma ghanense TaxID=65468 RepID=A0ABY2GST4_9HYPO
MSTSHVWPSPLQPAGRKHIHAPRDAGREDDFKIVKAGDLRTAELEAKLRPPAAELPEVGGSVTGIAVDQVRSTASR